MGSTRSHAGTRRDTISTASGRSWAIQDEGTFPLKDPEIQGYVAYNGDYLHRKLGIRFAYAFDVHGSSEVRTPPAQQLMLDILMGADQMDLTRTLLQTQILHDY